MDCTAPVLLGVVNGHYVICKEPFLSLSLSAGPTAEALDKVSQHKSDRYICCLGAMVLASKGPSGCDVFYG